MGYSVAQGSVRFVEVHVLTGEQLEARPPKVGEEFRVSAKMRNEGSITIYYLPTLCDTSLSATFDASYVRVETNPPRCLAASIPTPLKPREETVVSAPESGTAYVAIRGGSTSATVMFTYHLNADMSPATRQQSTANVAFSVRGLTDGYTIPGFPLEAIVLGIALSFGILLYNGKMKPSLK